MRSLAALIVVCCLPLAARAAESDSVKLVPFETGRQQSIQKLEETIHLGSGFVTHAAASGDLLAVATLRSTPARGEQRTQELPIDGPLPRTQWYGVATVDLYQFLPDGTTKLIASLPQRNPVSTVALNAARLYIADSVGVTAYGLHKKTREPALAWKNAIPHVSQISSIDSFLLFRSPGNLQAAEDRGNACILRSDTPAFIEQVAHSGAAELAFTVDRSGDCGLHMIKPSGSFAPYRDFPLLGHVLSLSNYGGNLLVLDDAFGLRLLNSAEWTKPDQRGRPFKIANSFDDPRFKDAVYKAKYVVADLPLAKGQARCFVFGTTVYLLDAAGKVSALAIDAQAKQFGKPQVIKGLVATEIVGDAAQQFAVGRDGSVTRLNAGKVVDKLLDCVESGPWFESNGQLFVARGNAVYAIESGTWGAKVFEAKAPILDIATQGAQVWVLGEDQLVAGEMKDGKLAVLGSVKAPAESLLLRLGPAYAAIVHGDSGLALVDIQDAKRPKIVADHQLGMPTHSEMVMKTGEHASFQRKIRDVLIEDERMFVLGTEVFLYDLKTFVASKDEPKWKSQWHRPYHSGGDIIYSNTMTAIGGGRYLVTAYRHMNFPYSRAYIFSMNGDTFGEWRYCRLGAASALDVKTGPDGLTFVAAGYDGLRVLELGDKDIYLGSEYDDGQECQSVLVAGDQVFARSGNEIRRYKLEIKPIEEATAFTFESKGGALPTIAVDGLDVTSDDYRLKMGYRNKLKLAKTDLSDDAGWPNVTVLQGTVAVDPKLGRIKFADGRNAEPEMLSRSEHINVYLAGWRKVGKYVIAALSEQSQGFAVMDLSDPTCMKVLSLAGQPNQYTYPHTVIAARDGYAYITGNVMNCLLPVNMKDPLKPKYERMINLMNGGVGKFACIPGYTGFFRGDRLYVPGGAGIAEIDVSDPENIQRVAVHPKGAAIHQVLDDQQRGIRWNAGALEYLDLADPANPVILGSYQPKTPLGPISTFTADGSTYVLSVTDGKAGRAVYRIDVSDMKNPQLVGKIDVADYTKGILAEKGYVYLSGVRTFQVVDWQEPQSPRIVGSLEPKDFLGTWQYSYVDKEPRITEVAGGAYGAELPIELKDGNTVWLQGQSACYSIDVADPANPKVVGSGPGFGEAWWVTTDDSEIATIGSYRRGFFDISDPHNVKCLKEWYHGHPYEVGTPSRGAGTWQVGVDNIWKWTIDEQTKTFTPEPWVKLPMWLGLDSETVLDGKPTILVTGGNGKVADVQTEKIPVKSGEIISFRGQVRTVAGTNYPFSPSSFDWPHGTVTLALLLPTGKFAASAASSKADGQWYPIGGGYRVPAGVDELTFQIKARGSVWLTDLELKRGDEELLKNPNFDQPLDAEGMHPHWNIVQAGGQRQAIGTEDDETLYLTMGRDLLLYDVTKKNKLPVARIPAILHPERDGPMVVEVQRVGDKKFAYVFTQLGVVSIDVTDPYHPKRLGALSLPVLTNRRTTMASGPNCLAVVPGFTSTPLTEGFYLIDTTDPANMRLRAAIGGRRHSGVAYHNGYLYVGDYDQGAQVWDVRDMSHPKMITDQGFDRCSQVHDLDFHGNYVLRPEVGGLEVWEAPVVAQAPTGELTVE